MEERIKALETALECALVAIDELQSHARAPGGSASTEPADGSAGLHQHAILWRTSWGVIPIRVRIELQPVPS